MKIGYIGLGKMGKNMVLHLLEQGIEVVAWNRSPEPLQEVASKGAVAASDISDLVSKLAVPRIIWLMLPAGAIIDEFIDKIIPSLLEGDLVIDGGNSFYKDSIARAQKLSNKGIHFMDIGVSGGPSGAREGACLMVGGSKEDYQRVLDIIKAASAPEAFGYLGKIGAGHFAKMIHNGIEYGMMEAIAEGASVLQKSDFDFDLAEVFRVYNQKSVIESRLVGWAGEVFQENLDLFNVSSKIHASGEGEWTINSASELGVEVPVIETSFKVRQESSEVSGDFRAKVVSALRGKFGGHATGDKSH